MADDLRTRISQMIWQRWVTDMGMSMPTGMADKLADAVIAELGLIRDPFSTVAFCRYVTQWQPNERFAPYCNRCGIPHTTPCQRPDDA
jgi:hypothetical protein